MALIPPVGTSGIYKLDAPFAAQLQPNMSYRCDAIRRLSDLLELGIDPFAEFYDKNGLTKEKYDADVVNQVCMISLVSSSGHWLYVPSTYVLAYPDLNGVPYTVMVLGLELGAIPNYKDLTGLKQALANLTRDTIGVMPTVKEVAVSAVSKLSQADADALEAARQQLITNSQTDRAKLLAVQQAYASLQQQYAALEAYVQQHALTQAPTSP
ncbi:hypothetical protein [Ralstonia phage RP31]|uniref:Uncharacterized protein n=2 Tax=Ripduovirus RP12 TaxID=2560700 RepID=A0A1L7N0P9_9CAUD|nr:hypothetical protein FDH28_gp066 [Ralstonia phage RP12]BAW19040.1 hypothetical protein [Ralstonia phage RP12]BAW19325.1 hypothetical protein [Ralstonia phage RP31]